MNLKSYLIGIAVSVLALVAVRAADTTPANLIAGKKVYTGKCARCHKLYDPTKYDDEKWSLWMIKMREKAKLNDGQYQQLSGYLESVRAKASK